MTRTISEVNPSDTEPQGWWNDSKLGRSLLSILVFAFAAGMIVYNIPDGPVREDIRDGLAAPVNMFGMNQGWEVFAPNPPRTHVVMTARITFDDGSETTFGFPEGEPILGAYREYRWRKWERRLRLSKNSGFRAATTDWIAGTHSDDQRTVTEVVLVETQARTPDIGKDPTLDWATQDVYVRTFEPGRSPRGRTLD